MNPTHWTLGLARPDRQHTRCPHCEWYPKLSSGFVCEACVKIFELPGWRRYRATGEKDWTVYHVVHSGDLPGRHDLEQEMRLRLVSEHRCKNIKCGVEKPGPYAYCHYCRDKLSLQGYREEADLKVATPPGQPSLNDSAVPEHDGTKVIWPLLGDSSDTESPLQERIDSPWSTVTPRSPHLGTWPKTELTWSEESSCGDDDSKELSYEDDDYKSSSLWPARLSEGLSEVQVSHPMRSQRPETRQLSPSKAVDELVIGDYYYYV